MDTPARSKSRFKIPSKTPRSISKKRKSISPRVSINVTPRNSPSASKAVKPSPLRRSPQAYKNSRTDSPLNSGKFGAISFNSPVPNTTYTRHKQRQYDRFIPNRHAMDSTAAQYHIKQGEKTLENEDFQYQEMLAKACGVALDKRILSFSMQPSSNDKDLRHAFNRPMKPKNNKRRIPLVPEKVLDAPGFLDDFYLNLIDWSATNLLAVALDDTVYIWNGDTGTVHEFCRAQGEDYISSLKFTADGSYLAVGISDGDAQIWDVDTNSKIRSMKGRNSRVGVLAWESHILSSGAKDGAIWNHDVRIARHKVGELQGHSAEICGLTWRADGSQLASGANDNLVQIWDARSSIPRMTKDSHTAAVKALAWCPWQLNLLGTGGGSGDHWLNFWNTTNGTKVNSIKATSQVTSIQWSTKYKEFVTSHGFPNNELSIWSYPKLQKIADLPGHDARILNTTLSPSGETVASAAADENLKFWKVFEGKNNKKMDDLTNEMVGMTIR